MAPNRTKVEIAKDLCYRLVNLRQPCERRALVKKFKNPQILDEMETRGLCTQQKNREEYLPTAGSFALLDDNDPILERARLGTTAALHTLKNMFEVEQTTTQYTLDDLVLHANDIYDYPIPHQCLRLGLYLAREFGALQMFRSSPDGLQIESFAIAENVVTIDPDEAWAQRMRNAKEGASDRPHPAQENFEPSGRTADATHPALAPKRAAEIIADLIENAQRLADDPFGSTRREQWTTTAKGALERAFGRTSSILSSFGAAQSIAFKAGDTKENLRAAANGTLESEVAVLRSAIEQLDWQIEEEERLAGPSPWTEEQQRTDAKENRPVHSALSTFDVGDADLLIVNGATWKDTRVEDSAELRRGRFWGSSVSRVTKLSFEDLGGYFDEIEISLPGAKKDPYDWDFGYLEAELRAAVSQRIKIAFRLEYDLEFWAKNYSISDLATAIENSLATRESPFAYWQRDKNTAIHGFGVSVEMSLGDTVWDALRLTDGLTELVPLIRADLSDENANAVSQVFDFPPPIKSACEQYLLYFVQFLSDLGIEAKAEIREQANKVLFSVTPVDEKQALENIREALRLYLGLPLTKDFGTNANQFHDVAVSQLQANVLHLQSQIMLARAAIEMKNATLDAKDAQIALLQERIDLGAFQPQHFLKEADAGKEELVKDLVAVKKWDYKFLEINFPELLRKLKRKLP